MSRPPEKNKYAEFQPTERFSTRVANYIKYRPSYPPSLLQELQTHGFLTESSVVGDIGAGTGKFSEILLDRGLEVYAVEPNSEMRNAAETLFCGNEKYHTVDGTGESTGLPNNELDLVVIAQAFHWFEYAASIREFKRILKPNGTLVFVWNDRHTDSPAFSRAYHEMLLEYCPEYESSPHRHVDEVILASAILPSQFHRFQCRSLIVDSSGFFQNRPLSVMRDRYERKG